MFPVNRSCAGIGKIKLTKMLKTKEIHRIRMFFPSFKGIRKLFFWGGRTLRTCLGMEVKNKAVDF